MCAVMFCAAPVTAVELARYPSDADPDAARQRHRGKTSDLGEESEVAGSSRLKQSTIERLSLCNSILQSSTGWLCAERSAALTRASSPSISSSKNHLSAITFFHE